MWDNLSHALITLKNVMAYKAFHTVHLAVINQMQRVVFGTAVQVSHGFTV